MPAADPNNKSLLVLFFRKELLFSLALGLAFARPCSARDLPAWDLDSLTFASTDIVEAELGAADGADATEATVTRVLAGKLHVGSKVPGLRFILNFFYPNPKAGDHVILFLDGRVRTDRLLMPKVAETPFLVLPSGLFMIDAAGRVHRYYQHSNPGPYDEEGAATSMEVAMHKADVKDSRGHTQSDSEPEDREWRKELDRYARESAALPKVAAVEADIRASLAYSAPLHSLLDTPADRARAPALMDLLRERQLKDRAEPQFDRIMDQIQQDATDRILALQDPQLMLDAYRFGYVRPSQFAQMGFPANDGTYWPSRVQFLTNVLASRTAALQARLSAAEILSDLTNSISTSSGAGGTWRARDIVRDHWGGSHRAVVESVGMRVLKDERENPVLRGRCAGLLDLGDSGQTAGAARVWASTRSGEVKFAIEVAFLRHSDADYKRLQPSVGPVTTIVRSWPDRWPVQTVPDGKIRFWGTSHLSRAFLEAYEHDMTSPDKVNFGFTLKNRATQKQLRFRLQDISDTGDSRYGYVDLDRETALPAGHYALAFIYTWDGKVVSSGHGMDIRVVASKAGNVIEAPPSSSMD